MTSRQSGAAVLSGEATRRTAAETRRQVVEATVALLEEQGARGLTVSAVMQRAAVSRTAFYRQFPDVYAVVSEVLEQIAERLATETAPWFRDPDAVGSVDIVADNVLRSAKVLKPLIKLMQAITDAAGLDEGLRTLWRDGVIQHRIDATAWAIRRDQHAGAIRATLDPDASALALILMGERVALEILGRQDGTPEQYARVIAPMWEATLFGSHQLEGARRAHDDRASHPR